MKLLKQMSLIFLCSLGCVSLSASSLAQRKLAFELAQKERNAQAAAAAEKLAAQRAAGRAEAATREARGMAAIAHRGATVNVALRKDNAALRAELATLRTRLGGVSGGMSAVAREASAVAAAVAGLPAGAASTDGAGLAGRLGSAASGKGGTALVAAGAAAAGAGLVALVSRLNQTTAELVAGNAELSQLRVQVTGLQRNLAESQAQALASGESVGAARAEVLAMCQQQIDLQRQLAAAQAGAVEASAGLVSANQRVADALRLRIEATTEKDAEIATLVVTMERLSTNALAHQESLNAEIDYLRAANRLAHGLNNVDADMIRRLKEQARDLASQINGLAHQIEAVTAERDAAVFRATEGAARADAADDRAGAAEGKAAAATEEAAAYRRALDAARAKLESETAKWNAAHRKLVDKLRASEAKLAEVQGLVLKGLFDTSAEESSVRSNLNAQLAAAQRAYEQQIAAMRVDFDSRLAALQKQLDAALTLVASTKGTAQQQLQRAAAAEALNAQLMEQLAVQQASFDAQRAQKEQELTTLGVALREAQGENTRLNQVRAMMAEVQSDCALLKSLSSKTSAAYYRALAAEEIKAGSTSDGWLFRGTSLPQDRKIEVKAKHGLNYVVSLATNLFAERSGARGLLSLKEAALASLIEQFFYDEVGQSEGVLPLETDLDDETPVIQAVQNLVRSDTKLDAGLKSLIARVLVEVIARREAAAPMRRAEVSASAASASTAASAAAGSRRR